jgi:hypothetical protein
MANRQSFTDQDWTLLRLAPSFVSVGVSAADPTGLIGSIKEAIAGGNELAATLKANATLELFAALAADPSTPKLPDIDALLGNGPNEQQLHNFKLAALDCVKRASDLVASKASAEEANAYRQMLVNVALKAASASKEGGFLGIGGVRVSDKERAFVNEVRAAAGIA